MLTVADCLQMEIFSNARVVAGNAGLFRRVAWVHVAGVPDAPEWLNGGELVLTTPFNLPKSTKDEVAYVQAMAQKGVAALAVAVGRYSKQTSEEMRQTAEEYKFPLIEIPFTTRFVDVAKAVNEQIAEANITLTQRALDINRRLTQLVLDNGDLQDLAGTMAGLIGQSISIENERFEILASHNVADVDEARRYTLSEGRTNPQLLATLDERGTLQEIRATLRPVHLPQIPEVGLEMERILAPIVVHGEIYGYMWIIADDRPLEDLDHMAIESGATIAALMLLYQEAAQNAEASLKGGLISQLIQGDSSGNAGHDAALIDQAMRYNVNMNQSFSLLTVEMRDGGAELLARLYRRLNRLASSGGWAMVAGQFAGQIVVLCPVHSAQQLAGQIHTHAADDPMMGSLRIAISGTAKGTRGAQTAYQQCQDALFIVRKLRLENDTVAFADLGYLHTLYKAGAPALETNPHVPMLRLLLQEQGADLFHTLETYVDEGGNGVQTAERLMIHRSTLNYRLARIAEIGGIELSDPGIRINLQVAIKLLRLFEIEQL